jgi:hypothetical protein
MLHHFIFSLPPPLSHIDIMRANVLAKLQAMDVPKKDKLGHAKLIAEFYADIEENKSALMDSNRIIGKAQDGITVKIPPDISKHLKSPKKD